MIALPKLSKDEFEEFEEIEFDWIGFDDDCGRYDHIEDEPLKPKLTAEVAIDRLAVVVTAILGFVIMFAGAVGIAIGIALLSEG